MRAWPWLLRLMALLSLPWFIPCAYRCYSGAFTGKPTSPYEGATGNWLRSNFHAHSRNWGSVSNGTLESGEVIRRYHSMGYDVPVLSDYMSITQASPVLAYEHGINFTKTHMIALGATGVFWFDQPIPSLNGKQFIIDGTHRQAYLVAIPHPMLDHRSYQMNDFICLDNYELVEVANRLRIYGDVWDTMLSNGHRVWAIGDDDSHDLTRPDDWGVAWTMVRAPSTNELDVLEALAAGHTYVVRTEAAHAEQWLHFSHLTLRGSTVHVTFEEAAESIRCIGQNGVERANVSNVYEATCEMAEDDGYLRVEATLKGTTVLLNPVTREHTGSGNVIDWGKSTDGWIGPLVIWLLGEIILRRLLSSNPAKNQAPRLGA